MRGLMQGAASLAALVAGAGRGVLVGLEPVHPFNHSRYRTGYAAYKRSNFHPTINRNTGKPHEHKREIARRLRQQGRLAGRSPGSHMG